MLSLSAPRFWGLTCSSASPAVSRAADSAGLLPSSSCAARDKGAESQPWHEYHHATTPCHSRPEGRWKKRGDRRTEERAGRRREVRTGAAPSQGQASPGAAWEEPAEMPSCSEPRCRTRLRRRLQHPSRAAGGRDPGSTFVHILS